MMPKLFTKMNYVVGLLVLACGPLAFADIIIVPPGLNPGNQYRLVFVTSGTRNAISANIEDYNSFVTNQANQNAALMSLGTTWKAIGSTGSVNARDNTGTNPSSSMGVPIYNLAGINVAASNIDLWDGGLQAPIMFNQTGASQSAVLVWTGTKTSGARDIELFFGDTLVITGGSGVATDLWVEGQANIQGGDHPLYAMSGIITAVPEPSSLLMVGFGTVLLSLGRLRRTHLDQLLSDFPCRVAIGT